MNLWSRLATFVRAEDGLGAVEWVALVGAGVIGAVALAWILMNGLKAPATSISSSLTACTVQGCK